MNSLSHYNLVHKIILMPQAMKNQMQQWTRMGKTREHTVMAADEIQKQK